jgi:hypothetical protein
MIGKCFQTGEAIADVTAHILLDEYPNDVLKISTVFARCPNGYSENSILLKRENVKNLVTMLQEWLGESLTMKVQVKIPKKKRLEVRDE